MAYFQPIDTATFRATTHVSGAWDVSTQHIAPALGLLVHAVEADRDRRRDDDLMIGRLSFDILGTVPVADVTVTVDVLRPGRTIELVEASLVHDGRTAVLLRAWLLQRADTGGWQAAPLPPIPPVDSVPAWDATTVWPGGFIASAEVRRTQREPGRAAFWVRTDQELIEGVHVSRLARTVGLLDIANGMTVRADPSAVAFPNVDLTAHLFRPPEGDWVGFDTTVSFGPGGVGVTASTLHDERGPFGTSTQCLTIRPASGG